MDALIILDKTLYAESTAYLINECVVFENTAVISIAHETDNEVLIFNLFLN